MRRAVDRARLLVRVVVRHVGGDDDQRLRAAPQALDHLGDLLHARAGRRRTARARTRPALSAGTAAAPRANAPAHARHRSSPPAADRARCAKRRRRCARVPSGVAKPAALGSARPAHRDAVRRARAARRAARCRAPRRARRRRARRRGRSRYSRRAARSAPSDSPDAAPPLLDAAEQVVDLGGERARVARIEHPCHRGGPDRCSCAPLSSAQGLQDPFERADHRLPPHALAIARRSAASRFSGSFPSPMQSTPCPRAFRDCRRRGRRRR